MGELKPVPIWPGGSATAPAAPSPASSTAAPAPSTSSPSSPRAFGMPARSAAAIAPKPTPAPSPAKPATPTGHPLDPWGQPWPGTRARASDFHPEGLGFPIAPSIGDRYRSGADTWILTPGGWRLMTSSRELPVGPPSSSSSASTGAFEAEKNALQAERDKHAEQARKLADLPMGAPVMPVADKPAGDEQPEHKPEPDPELEHADSEHKNRSHRRHR